MISRCDGEESRLLQLQMGWKEAAETTVGGHDLVGLQQRGYDTTLKAAGWGVATATASAWPAATTMGKIEFPNLLMEEVSKQAICGRGGGGGEERFGSTISQLEEAWEGSPPGQRRATEPWSKETLGNSSLPCAFLSMGEIYSLVFVFLSCIARAERAPTICMLILDCAPRQATHVLIKYPTTTSPYLEER
jgi:hypothetical protein